MQELLVIRWSWQEQGTNQAEQESACTLRQVCGSLRHLLLAPLLLSVLGWGTWTSEQHLNALSSSLTLSHQLHIFRLLLLGLPFHTNLSWPTGHVHIYAEVCEQTFYKLEFPLSQKGQGNFSEFQPIFSSNSLWFYFWGTVSLWVCPCPLMKSVTYFHQTLFQSW